MPNNLEIGTIKNKSISLLDTYIFSSFRNFFAISYNNNKAAKSLKNKIKMANSIKSINDCVIESQNAYINNPTTKEKSLSRYYSILIEIKAL